MKILGIVVARGGSKGIPGKNLKQINGRALIDWPVKAAQESGICSRLIVSSDSKEILDHCRTLSVEIPFIRPAELARDDSKTIDVVLHALSHFEVLGEFFDYVLLLQPTSPLLTKDDLLKAMIYLETKSPDTIISVFESKHFHPSLMYVPQEMQGVTPLLKDQSHGARRQEMSNVYIRTGLFYLAKTETLKTTRSFYGQHVEAVVVPYQRSVCIDEPFDLELCDFMFKYQEKGKL